VGKVVCVCVRVHEGAAAKGINRVDYLLTEHRHHNHFLPASARHCKMERMPSNNG
jgi:hypothetical protein